MDCPLTDDPPSYRGPRGVVRPERTKHILTEEGVRLKYGAYDQLYGGSQTRERLIERGGLFVSEISHFIEKGALPKGFDWTKYVRT